MYHIKKNNKLSKSYIQFLKNNFLDKNDYYIILKNFEKNNKILKMKVKTIANLIGKTLAQNNLGKKLVEVKPKINLLKKLSKQKKLEKLRYHQTNTGGSIHSDGPQLKKPPNYVLMACLKQANKGGHSIVTYTQPIYNFLKEKHPNYLKILKNNFLFEKRGFSHKKNNIFTKPIFEKGKNFFRFRYLREYIETAYKLKKINLKDSQIKALNLLDKLIHSSRFQKKFKLNKGDVIILNNNTLAHGRTGFPLNLDREQRTIIRIWIK